MKAANITDPNDPRLAAFQNLKDKQLACEHGLFIVEGEFLVRRLLASRLVTHSVLITEQKLAAFAWDFRAENVVYQASAPVISSIVGFEFHRGVLALGYRPEPKLLENSLDELADVRRLVICPEINDAENLGSILRTAAGLGYRHIILGESCCEPFARRAIRTSMGAVFQLETFLANDLEKGLAEIKSRCKFQWHAAIIDAAAKPLHTMRPPDKVGLLFGAEANGLAEIWCNLADERVRIPMALETDSLNVGVAAGIFMYYYQPR